MNLFDWNKLDSKVKKKIGSSRITFIPGSIHLSAKRVSEILKLAKSKGRPIIWGSFKDEYILDLENSPQFKTLDYSLIQKALIHEKFAILQYFQRDQASIIKELAPKNIIYIYGSWNSFIHYKPEFWNALDAGCKMEFISPFVDEDEGMKFEEVNAERADGHPPMHQGDDTQMMQLLEVIKTKSWAWERQTSAILAHKGKILITGYNKVLPYQWYQMHYGNIRENMRAASQEKNELQQTLHAEMMVLTEANKKGISLEGKDLFVELFPCGHCAKILANCGLRRIIYKHDHSHELGYKILEKSDVKLERLVVQ